MLSFLQSQVFFTSSAFIISLPVFSSGVAGIDNSYIRTKTVNHDPDSVIVNSVSGKVYCLLTCTDKHKT